MRIQKSNTRASALLITLVLMALLTILVVGLFETASLEETSASSNLEEARAEFCAQQAIERVTATLRSAAGTTNSYWISQPGQVVFSSEATNLPDTQIALSSGLADSALTNSTVSYSYHPANLNVPSFNNPTNFLVTEGENTTGTLVQMQMKWLYVRSDGTLDTNNIPVTNTANPIVGRYAYWTDDESSKVNYNLAWTRNATNTSPICYPTMVNLTALTNMTSSMADSIHNSITLNTNYAPLANGFFNSPDDGRRVSSSVAAVLNGSHFDLTHYNNDPDMTFFNQPKIVLTTQANRVPTLSDGVTLPYLNILTTPNTDPGIVGNLSSANVNTTMQMLVGYLTRTDWPMALGSSFQQKYYYTGSTYSNRIAQLAINIIDYVRCKESTQLLVAPLRISQTGTTYSLSTTSSSTGQYDFLGTGRGPFIDEIGVWFPASMTSTYNAEVTVEIYLPPNYGLPSVDLTQLTLFTEIETAGGTDLNANNAITAAEVSGGNTTLSAGQYAVVTQPVSITAGTSTYPASPPATRPTTTYLRCDLQAASGKLTITPLVDGTNYGISAIVDPTAITQANIHSMELDDPRLGQYKTDWHRCTSGNNSFGSANSVSTLGTLASSAIIPQQDADVSGNISSASFFMPPPASTIYTNTVTGSIYNNMSGMVNSIGELGFVDAGIESYMPLASPYQPGEVPWRTLRLQPSNEPNSVVPDWALMDIFTVPLTVTSTNAINSTNAAAIFTPNGTSVGGRININSQLQPFSPAPITSSSWPPRLAPLTALFYGAGNNSTNTLSTNSLAAAEAIATNIYNGTLAATANGNGKAYGTTSNYISSGQLAEIAGVADGGEASEETLRQVASLTTVRGNVFTVYSIGQAIKQTPSGLLVITGERRLQSMIERYVDATGTVNFRIVYFRAMSQSP